MKLYNSVITAGERRSVCYANPVTQPQSKTKLSAHFHILYKVQFWRMSYACNENWRMSISRSYLIVSYDTAQCWNASISHINFKTDVLFGDIFTLRNNFWICVLFLFCIFFFFLNVTSVFFSESFKVNQGNMSII